MEDRDRPLLEGEEVAGEANQNDWEEEPWFPGRTPFAKYSEGGQRRCLKCFGVGLVLSLLVAIGLPLFITKQVNDGIRGDVVIDSPKASGYDQFLNQSDDGNEYVEFYFWNLTNPRDVMHGAKPVLEQIGPFVYSFYTIRTKLEWNRTDDSLRYHEHTYFKFNERMTVASSGYMTDEIPITTLNLVFWGAKALVGDTLWPIASDLLFGMSKYNKLFETKTVIEWITGYNVYLDLLGFKIPINFPGLYPNSSKVTYSMRVGEDDWSRVYEILEWKGMKNLTTECPFLGAEYCHAPCCKSLNPFAKNKPIWTETLFPGEFDEIPNDLTSWMSHNGEQFSPKLKKDAELVIFNEVVQRPLRFHYDKDTSYRGIDLWRFVPHSEMFSNRTIRPANGRYYMFDTPQGILSNLSIVEQGVDVYASLPHFLHGDQSLHDGVIGMKPDHEAHAMFIEVEPILGQTMVEHVRAQINGRFSKQVLGKKYFPGNLTDDTYVPIAWFDQVSLVNDRGVTDFNQIPTAYAIRKGAIIVGSIFSVLCVCPLLYALNVSRSRQRKRSQRVSFDI